MPDITGALSAEDNAKIAKWWTTHWKGVVVCPVCKTNEWTQAPHVVNFPRHAVDANAPNTVSYPHIVVTCKNCAHSMFFNAVQIGVSAAAPRALPMPLPLPPIFPTAPFNTTTNALAKALGNPEPPANPLGSLFKKD